MIIGFHNPDEENGYLSNWTLSHFTLGTKSFSSMEQFMMVQKAVCFNDLDTAAQIMNTTDAGRSNSWAGWSPAMMTESGTVSGRSLSLKD